MSVTARIVWRKPENCLVAGPRLTIDSDRFGKYQFFARSHGWEGTVYRRWVVIARFLPGESGYAWFLTWEPKLTKTLGFSYKKSFTLRQHMREVA